MESNNPVLKKQVMQDVVIDGERMTINGTINKTGLLLLMVVATGAWTWHHFSSIVAQGMASGADPATVVAQASAAVTPFMIGGLLVGLALAFATIFKPTWAGVTAPAYALAEGFALGGISAIFELRFPGIVLQAIMLTVGVLAVMLMAYRSGWINVTDKFRMGVVAATGAILLLYVVDMLLRAFTSGSVPFIHESGMMGIGFSLLVVGLAALNLVLDFDLIEQSAEQGAPKYMEWYGGFALMVTLVWLYMELLRLLSKLRE